MILVAVAAITAERLLRADHSESHAAVNEPLPPGLMAKCNVSSIASATGLNRETTRRKVDTLIDKGLLVRLDNGTITFAPGVVQEQSTQELVRRQLEDVIRTANDLVRDGVLDFTRAEPGANAD
jgi:DNA-binding IclR family transcriptional regulator